MRLFGSIAWLACSALLAAAPAAGQVSTGEIFGKVADTTGAVLPGATVTITSPALIQSQSVVTAASGGYRFPNLPVGTYAVSFDLTGFKKTLHTDVVIQAGFNAEINAKLEISTVQETVTVSGVSPIVDTKSNTLGTNFSKDLLDAIPSARDPWVILEQTPGMVMDRENSPAELIAQGGGAGNAIKDVAEYGFEVGGPIKKDKAWFWGAANHNSIRVGIIGFLKAGAPAGSSNIDDLETDLSMLNNQNLKLNYQWVAGHWSTFLFKRGEKIRGSRGASRTAQLSGTTRQSCARPYHMGQP